MKSIIDQAIKLATKGDWGDRSIQINLQITESKDFKNKERSEAYSRLGMCHVAAGRFFIARGFFGMALEINPQNGIAKRKFDACENLQDYPKIDDINCPLQLIELCRAMIALGRKDAVKPLADKAEFLASSVFDLNTLGGFLRNDLKKAGRARIAYKKAMEVEWNPASIVGDAACLSDSDQLDAAEQKLLPIVKDYPYDAYALKCLGALYMKQGRREEAMKLFARSDKIEEE